jgi:hypothetical protein
MTIRTTLPSGEAMDQLISIGFEEGVSTAAAALTTSSGPTSTRDDRHGPVTSKGTRVPPVTPTPHGALGPM